jgi:hypothetical protein
MRREKIIGRSEWSARTRSNRDAAMNVTSVRDVRKLRQVVAHASVELPAEKQAYLTELARRSTKTGESPPRECPALAAGKCHPYV